MNAVALRHQAAEGMAHALLASSPRQPTSATARMVRSAVAALEPTGVVSVSQWLNGALYRWLVGHLAAAIAPHLVLLSEAVDDATLPEDVRARFRARLAEIEADRRDGAWVWAKPSGVLTGILDAAGVALAGRIAERMERGPLPVPSAN